MVAILTSDLTDVGSNLAAIFYVEELRNSRLGEVVMELRLFSCRHGFDSEHILCVKNDFFKKINGFKNRLNFHWYLKITLGITHFDLFACIYNNKVKT